MNVAGLALKVFFYLGKAGASSVTREISKVESSNSELAQFARCVHSCTPGTPADPSKYGRGSVATIYMQTSNALPRSTRNPDVLYFCS